MLYAKMYESQERRDDMRWVVAHIVKFGGMGSSDNISLDKIMHLPLLDNEIKELPIRNLEEAMSVLNKLLNG